LRIEDRAIASKAVRDPLSSILHLSSSILDNFVSARRKIFLASPLNSLAHFIRSKIESSLP
jgi:hypothetical protein